MKLICNGADLSQAVGQVIKAAATKSTSPILEGILLKAEGGTLTLTATDLELAIEKHINADIKIEGTTVVPGRFFAEFVKKLTHERIELSLIDSKLKIRYSDSEGFLQTLNPNEFPPIKELDEAQKFVILRNEFKDMINKVAFSVCQDDSRPILKGVLLEVVEGCVTAVALDGYRLAKCVKPLEKTTALMSAVVPARCIVEIARILDDTNDPVEVLIQKNHLVVNLDHTKITTRLLDGDYLNYKNIIPKDFESVVTVPKEHFESALERAVLLSKTEKANLVKYDLSGDVLKLESNSEIGNLSEKIPVKIKGVDIVIAFNARYFTELLKYIAVDHIQIKFTSPTSPCIVTPASGTDDLLYLILPVRLA